MTRVRTFVDSSVLIAAARGTNVVAQRALQILDDPSRDFVTSDFVRLEVLPKPLYHRNNREVMFYETFIEHAAEVVSCSPSLVAEDFEDAATAGLSAVDALHVAAARHAGSDELVTSEKGTKPLFRVTGISVSSIRPV